MVEVRLNGIAGVKCNVKTGQVAQEQRVLVWRTPPERQLCPTLVRCLERRSRVRNDGFVISFTRRCHNLDKGVIWLTDINSVKFVRPTCRLIYDGAQCGPRALRHRPPVAY